MTRYTHPDHDGLFPKPSGVFVTVDGDQIGSSFFRASSPQKIAAMGFRVYQPPEPEPPTPEQVIEGFRAAIQSHVDAQAVSRRYDSGNSLATYVNSTNPQWSAEAAVFVAWRDAVWAYAYAEMDKVLGGERVQPTVEAFLTELPEIVWPA